MGEEKNFHHHHSTIHVMDDCILVRDIWVFIIRFAELESLGVWTQTCRHLHALVTKEHPWLNTVPDQWRSSPFPNEFLDQLVYPKETKSSAFFFVRELARYRVHEIPGVAQYLILAMNGDDDCIFIFSLEPRKRIRDMGFHFDLSYRICVADSVDVAPIGQRQTPRLLQPHEPCWSLTIPRTDQLRVPFTSTQTFFALAELFSRLTLRSMLDEAEKWMLGCLQQDKESVEFQTLW